MFMRTCIYIYIYIYIHVLYTYIYIYTYLRIFVVDYRTMFIYMMHAMAFICCMTCAQLGSCCKGRGQELGFALRRCVGAVRVRVGSMPRRASSQRTCSLRHGETKPRSIWQLINIPVSGKRHLREKRVSFANLSRLHRHALFVCSVHSGAIVAAAVMLANTVAAVHLRAVRSVKCKQSPSFALATCACRQCAEPCNKLPGLSPVFRETCSKIAQTTLLICTIPNTGRESIMQV